MPKIASLDEVLEFANKVRAAGGGNPIDALMPAVPEDVSQCLIAKNLNFNCTVGGNAPAGRPSNEWWMGVADEETRDKIAEELNLLKGEWTDFDQEDLVYGVRLPAAIGRVAEEFDEWSVALMEVWDEEEDRISFRVNPKADRAAKNRLKKFLPYIEESEREAYELAGTNINDKGEIVL